MSKFWIIATDVYKKNIKSASFIIMILAPFLLMGIAYLAITLASDHSKESLIGVVSSETEISQQLAGVEADSYKFEAMPSQAEAEKALADGKIDAFLIVDQKNEQISGKLYVESSLGAVTELTVEQILNSMQSAINASKLGLSAEEVSSLNATANFDKEKVRFDSDGKMTTSQDNTMAQFALSYGITIVLFLIIMTYSSIIAQEIASEKGTRIMEVLLSSTKAQTHFYGKLIGIIGVALTQILIYVLAFGLGYSQFSKSPAVSGFLNSFDLSQLIGQFLLFTFIFFILGIVAYSVLAALCGSLVSKAEDTAKAVQPIMYFAMIGYIIGLAIGSGDPQNIVVKVSSYIPLISSFTMPVRLASETVGMTEVLISIAIFALSTVLMTIFSAKLYKSNVLVYNEGGVLKSLKQSISILKNENKKA